jgi:hypothetical protein
MIVVFCHLYHQNLWDEIQYHINKINKPKKLYFNLVNDQDLLEIKKKIKSVYPFATILESPNQGRDCGGNLRLIGQWLEDGAPGELIIQIHTKTNHFWRHELFNPVFANIDYLYYLFSDARVGMVGGNDWLISRYHDMNINHYNSYRERFGISLSSPMSFIGGTVFCIRSSIYKDFFTKHNPIKLASELEFGAMGEPSYTHAMERIFGAIVPHLGYTIKPCDNVKKLLDLFDEEFYLSKYADIKSQIGHKFYSAFSHFLKWGRQEGRQINRMLFDKEFYYEQNPDVKNANTDAYLHFLNHGCEEGRLAKFLPVTSFLKL